MVKGHMTDLLSLRDEGLVLSLSRWTDIPATYMPQARKWFEEGKVKGPHPFPSLSRLLPMEWSLDPTDLIAIQWWTKWPVALLRDLSGALAAWRDLSYINLTITGWQEVELAVPPLDAQIEAAVATINMMGADRVRWRYSPVPIPLDAKNLQRLDCIAMALAQHGVTECHVRSMESNPKDKFEIPGPERRAADYSIISSVVGRYGMVAKVCREDLIAIPTAQEVRCINPKQVGACGLRTEKECGCAASMDPGQGIRCRMGCTYCYANPAVAVG